MLFEGSFSFSESSSFVCVHTLFENLVNVVVGFDYFDTIKYFLSTLFLFS